MGLKYYVESQTSSKKNILPNMIKVCQKKIPLLIKKT
jgi:hypothetical protein